jgi:hypothetical protein
VNDRGAHYNVILILFAAQLPHMCNKSLRSATSVLLAVQSAKVLCQEFATAHSQGFVPRQFRKC